MDAGGYVLVRLFCKKGYRLILAHGPSLADLCSGAMLGQRGLRMSSIIIT